MPLASQGKFFFPLKHLFHFFQEKLARIYLARKTKTCLQPKALEKTVIKPIEMQEEYFNKGTK